MPRTTPIPVDSAAPAAPTADKAVTTPRIMIPRTSSITAAPSMVVPSRERKTFSSMRVWAEMETEVAVRIVPTKMASQ